MSEITSNRRTIAPDFLPPCSLHYLTAGNPANPVVFCVHGLTCVAHDFDYLARVLSDDFYIIAPDMPGRGDSDHLDKAEDYNNYHHMLYCLALLDALNIQRVHWVGASMGGIIGLMIAKEQPELLQTLFLGDVGSILAKEGLKEIFENVSSAPKVTTNAEFEAAMKRTYAQFAFSKEEYWQHFFRHRVRINAQGQYRLRLDPKIMLPFKAQAALSIEDVSLMEYWQAVPCPTLIFRGAESRLLRHDTALQMTVDKPNVTLREFAGVGHMPNLMETEQIMLMHEWLLMHRT
jgi:pimeloyl-ACP methyl ester carboxylesterase